MLNYHHLSQRMKFKTLKLEFRQSSRSTNSFSNRNSFISCFRAFLRRINDPIFVSDKLRTFSTFHKCFVIPRVVACCFLLKELVGAKAKTETLTLTDLNEKAEMCGFMDPRCILSDGAQPQITHVVSHQIDNASMLLSVNLIIRSFGVKSSTPVQDLRSKVENRESFRYH